MYRFLVHLSLLCSASPLWACSCGGTLSYAPLVAAPPVVFFGEPVEFLETLESATTEAVETRQAEKPALPAIPRSIDPDSFAQEPVQTEVRQSRLTLSPLRIFDLPTAIMKEQPTEPSEAENKPQMVIAMPAIPMILPFQADSMQVQPEGQNEDATREDVHPPAPKISDEENEDTTTENGLARSQAPSQRDSEALQTKPESPGGPADISIPVALTGEPENTAGEPTETYGSRRDQERDSENQTSSEASPPASIPDGKEGGMGPGVPVSQWTTTVLVMLAAFSTCAFLCTVFVVGEYRRRWLNAIMTQNGMLPGFRGGLYDIPGVSISYGRYEE